MNTEPVTAIAAVNPPPRFLRTRATARVVGRALAKIRYLWVVVDERGGPMPGVAALGAGFVATVLGIIPLTEAGPTHPLTLTFGGVVAVCLGPMGLLYGSRVLRSLGRKVAAAIEAEQQRMLAEANRDAE